VLGISLILFNKIILQLQPVICLYDVSLSRVGLPFDLMNLTMIWLYFSDFAVIKAAQRFRGSEITSNLKRKFLSLGFKTLKI